jgi:hypothetical protein
VSKLAVPTRVTLLLDADSAVTQYVGEASSGVQTSSPFWRIRQIVYTGNSIAIKYADGNPEFDNVWDNRAILTYA